MQIQCNIVTQFHNIAESIDSKAKRITWIFCSRMSSAHIQIYVSNVVKQKSIDPPLFSIFVYQMFLIRNTSLSYLHSLAAHLKHRKKSLNYFQFFCPVLEHSVV